MFAAASPVDVVVAVVAAVELFSWTELMRKKTRKTRKTMPSIQLSFAHDFQWAVVEFDRTVERTLPAWMQSEALHLLAVSSYRLAC